MKKKLILLHGALGSSKSFNSLIPHLSNDFDLIIPDLKWHGSRADASDGFTMEDLVNDFEGILQDENVQSVNVFGFSMGGYVALSLALKKPEIFERIMTLGTKLDWKPEEAEKETKMLNSDKILEKVPQFAQHLKSLHGENWEQLCRQTAQMMMGLGNHPILNTDNISTINLPVRLGLGDRDNMVSLNETATFFESFPQGQLQVFANCVHPIEKINSEFLSISIKDFLKN